MPYSHLDPLLSKEGQGGSYFSSFLKGKPAGVLKIPFPTMHYISNRSIFKSRRSYLRAQSTTPEQKLWSKLRNKQMGSNYKFRRQFGVGTFIVDFYCPTLKLAIEVDGNSHTSKQAQSYDRWREKYLKTLGITYLRFTNEEIMKNLDGVLMTIFLRVKEKEDIRKKDKK